MTSPYINTKLYTRVLVQPNQLNNEIYRNLKHNLIKKIANKCYKDYGYIQQIYEITRYKDANIPAENSKSPAYYNVDFSCKLCIPIVNRQIICKIISTSDLFLTASNGPILVVITNDRKNNDIFFTDGNNRLRRKLPNKRSEILRPGDIIKITVQSRIFSDGDNKIKVIGFINDMATKDEIVQFENEENDNL